MHTEIDRQVGRQIDRQIDRQTDKQMTFNGSDSSLMGEYAPFLVLKPLGKWFDECGMRAKRGKEF